MAIDDRNVPIGTRLVANYKKARYVCTVEAGEEEGGLAFVLEDGSRHKSPSAAGSKVMGGKAVNGWRFWTVEGDAPAGSVVADLDALLKEAGKPERKPRGRKNKPSKTITKMADQAGAAEGQMRFFCSACMDAFAVDGKDEPEACPKGHRNDDPELNAPSGVTAAEEAGVTA
jgi:hypothetical protein